MDELKIEHLKGLCVISLTKHLMEKENMNHEDAYKKLLSSKTYSLLMNTDSDLYLETDGYLIEAFEKEASEGEEALYSFINQE